MGLTKGQRVCVETLDRSIVVAAGAGSGKTYTLKERIAHAFESGFLTDIDQVCAITFTTKAAAELKSRIKAELKARGRIEQSLKVDDAWISTIHGMCSRILKAHAVELGIDPSFGVLDPADASEYLSLAVDAVLANAQAGDSSPQIDALFEEYPARSSGGWGESVESMLHVLVDKAAENPRGIDAFEMPGVTLAPPLAVSYAIDLMEGLVASAEAQKGSKSRDAWIASESEKIQQARQLMESGVNAPEQALQAIGAFKVRLTFGDADFKARAAEAKVQLASFVMEMRLACARPHLDTLVVLARRSMEAFAALKREDGLLDNSDLLIMAARAIEEHPDIAQRYVDKFKLVMVDEFQDTNQMQVDMIKRIAGPNACRLCTVGDAQQSIYGFRGADVAVYRRHLESVKAADEEGVIKLSENFRSHADVLSFVDRVFEQQTMFGGQFMSLAPKRESKPGAPAFAKGQPRIVVQHTIRPDASSRTGEVARRIAEQFAQWRSEGHRASEMVVLLRGMKSSGVFAQALREQGFSCVIAGGSVFSESLEAKVVLNLVCYMANPQQTNALLNVLVSPMFCLTAGDLADAGEGVPKRSLRVFGLSADAPTPSLACAQRVMKDVRTHAGTEKVWRTVQRAVIDSGWLSRLDEQGPEGQASAANVHKAIRLLRTVEESGPFGPASAAARFEHLLANAKEPPGALSVSGGDSVKIMTFHASKGLEFPIVAVAGMPDDRGVSGKLLATESNGTLFISLDAGNSAKDYKVDASSEEALSEYVLGSLVDEDDISQALARDEGALHRRLALKAGIAQGEAEESKRLLYVAITRAREACLVATDGRATKDNPCGLPKGASAGVLTALLPSGDVQEGVTMCDFRGEAPAVLDCVALSKEEDEAPDAEEALLPGELPGEDLTGPCAEEEDARLFSVPAASERAFPEGQTFKALHEGIFSYSSIADASHEGDVLVQLADRFAVSVEGAPAHGSEHVEQGSEGPLFRSMPILPASIDDEDDPWGFFPSRSLDDDHATDLGTAFHRLAQHAVIAHRRGEPLCCPNRERIEALSTTCRLGELQRMRLGQALDRWFSSSVAHHMASMESLAAEVPFFVAVPGADKSSAYLEGEIDLLGFDDNRSAAHVVDYKTGGHDDETASQLREKHVLQAACYAYAIMLQGVQQVDARFVRVERASLEDPGQPQCIHYRFSQEDLPMLGEVIRFVYERMQER